MHEGHEEAESGLSEGNSTANPVAKLYNFVTKRQTTILRQESQMEKSRKRLEQFLVDLLDTVGRSERRQWASVYVRGLLLDGERKSIEPMADRLPEGNVQAMQQLVGQSPWAWDPVWERLGRRMTAELEPDPVWVVDDTGFPKKGKRSVGVERQYSGTLGKTANCQVAVSLHHVGEQGSSVLGWRLYLPESWARDEKRRKAAGVPEEVVFRTKWQLALDMIDRVRSWGLPDRVVVADGGYGEATDFREALESRGLRYQRPSNAREVALKAKRWKDVRWREGSKGWLRSRFMAMRVQPSHGFVDGQPPRKEVWLLVEWPETENEPTRYFLCDLSPNYTLRRLVRLAKSRWKIEQDYQQLKEELGLDHYEGRREIQYLIFTWTGVCAFCGQMVRKPSGRGP
jgi:SRSO17 transposase